MTIDKQSAVSAKSSFRWSVALLGRLVPLALALTLAFVGGSSGLDLGVYRDGGAAVLRGLDFYRPGLGPLGDPGLPFTYPPFAAMLFTVFAVIPMQLCSLIMAVASALLGLAVLDDLARRAVGAGLLEWRLAAWLVPLLGFCSASFFATLGYGQINLLLLGAVYLCFARVTSEPMRAVFPWVAVGIAAGIKLTPLALLLIPLALMAWRPILIGAASFFSTQLIGLVALPQRTVAYWGDVIWDPSRVGGVNYIDNASLKGVLGRFGAPHMLLLALLVLTLLLGALAIRRLHLRANAISHLGVASAVMLLISPISWIHHFVWWPVIAFALMIGAQLTGAAAPRTLLKGCAGTFVLSQIVSAKALMGVFGYDIQGPPPGWAMLLAALPAFSLIVGLAVLAVSRPTSAPLVSPARDSCLPELSQP